MTRKILLTLLLLALLWNCAEEMRAALTAPQSWDMLLSPLPLLTVIAAALLLLDGLAVLVFQIWAPEAAARLSMRAGRPAWFKWAAPASLLLFAVWFLLFSPWQVVFTGLWTKYLFLLALAALIAFSSGRQDETPGWREAALALLLLLYTGMVQEARQMTPLAVIYRGLTLAGAALAAGAAVLLYHPERFRAAGERLTAWRGRIRGLRGALGFLFALTPILLFLIEGRMNFAANPFCRFSAMALALPFLAALASEDRKRLFTPTGWITAAGMLLFANVLAYRLTSVTDYPFSMTWSEGNRFYDYSLTFAGHLYNYPGKLEVPYFSPGRYALWGSLFLIPGLPIWAHRLWNVFLLTIPALVVGGMLARPARTSPLFLPFWLWMTLYLLQGPILPPLLVALMLFLPFLFAKSPWVRAVSLAATSLAAGLSRWTWAVGPGVWGALADLFLYYPQRKGTFLRRLAPTAALALLGVLPGVLASWGEVWDRSASFASSQPLLWYRLWANASNTIGILPGILRASGPLAILLVWLAVSRRWKMDWVQAAAAAGASLAFFGAGIVMSMKIGGGGDLHNLDLFLLTTALLASLAVHALHKQGIFTPGSWPRWAQAALALCLLIPGWNASRVGAPVEIPPRETITEPSLRTVQGVIAAYEPQGEILFMDQRQLLTFGYLPPVPFTPDYEKKYMMDQAMAGNAAYFAAYYRDLANRRFALILTEPLHVHRAGSERYFGEENDAWVHWVSAPTLCFYKPRMLLKDVGVQFLVPRENTEACARYLDP